MKTRFVRWNRPKPLRVLPLYTSHSFMKDRAEDDRALIISNNLSYIPNLLLRIRQSQTIMYLFYQAHPVDFHYPERTCSSQHELRAANRRLRQVQVTDGRPSTSLRPCCSTTQANLLNEAARPDKYIIWSTSMVTK
jgi:hypothetical protein